MPELSGLTTRSAEWSQNIPPAPEWTNWGNILYAEFNSDEQLPLLLMDAVPKTSYSLVEKRQCENGSIVAVEKIDIFLTKIITTELINKVQILRSLKHYHSRRTLGCYTYSDFLSIVMEPWAVCDLRYYLSYPSSRRVRRMEDRYGPREKFLPKIMGCLAHGLQYIHKEPRTQHENELEKMIRHRDITPSNILLDGTRVLYADFGLSKFFPPTQRGSSGPSRKTIMYTSPERNANGHQDKSCDIFSLACVFAEIFTVHKGKTVADFLTHREKADPEREGWFHKATVMPAVLEWLEALISDRCDVQMIQLLRAMFNLQPEQRPNAEQVWKSLTTCTKSSDTTDIHFCGPCCMPLILEDPLLKAEPGVDPSRTQYISPAGFIDNSQVNTDPLNGNSPQ